MKIIRYKRIFREVFHVMGADKIVLSYIIFFIAMSLLMWIVEPNINTFMDSIWFCFATASTVGYGDITALSVIGRILAIILSLYSVAVIAIITAVITSYFIEQAKVRAKNSAREFLDNLEHLDELSKEELKELSEKIRKFDESF